MLDDDSDNDPLESSESEGDSLRGSDEEFRIAESSSRR